MAGYLSGTIAVVALWDPRQPTLVGSLDGLDRPVAIALDAKLEHLVQKVPGFVKIVAPASLPFTLMPTRPIVLNARRGSTNRWVVKQRA